MTDIDILLVKALALRSDAERKVDKIEKSWINFFTSKSIKYEEAAELFVKAAKQYQLARVNMEAGNAYLRATECYQHSEFSRYNVAQCYVHAAHNFTKQDIKAGITALEKAVVIYAEDGKFSQAARYEKELAELYEKYPEFENIPEIITHAIKHYEIAAEYFEMEGSIMTSSESLSKVVPLYALKGDYHKAIKVLEKISEFGKSRVKENCLKAGILYLCVSDTVAANTALEKWERKYPELKGTRECEFLREIVEAAMQVDQDRYRKAIAEWNSVVPLDTWKQTYLKIAEDKNFEEENFT